MPNVDSSKTYIGVVEDNNDPKKLGRVKVRVMDIYESLKLEDIPWATPWKDLNGNSFNLPDKGKVVIVTFDSGNKDKPEYISSDHFNSNLEKKLSQLNNNDYLSMKSLLFDHKTQIYVNDSEGLKLDHKFNNVNVKEDSIDLNLKDNFGKVNIGTHNSTQQAILGNHFMDWLMDFLNILMGDKGGPFLGNLGAPVIASPALMAQIQLLQAIKDPKILSKNVYLVDNENVEKLDRIAEGQKGDVWKSTVEDNKITTVEKVDFKPIEGTSTQTFDKPSVQTTTPPTKTDLLPPETKVEKNPDVDILLKIISDKKYTLYTRPYEMNIVTIRNQCVNIGDKYTDQFVDQIYLLYKDDKDNWNVKKYMFSSVPGVEFEVTNSWLKEKKFENSNYWLSMVGKKITLKDYYSYLNKN